MRARASLAFFVAALVAALPARADGVDSAEAHFAAGDRALAAGDPQAALREFETAQALGPSPVLGWYIGLAHDQMGEPCVALTYYRRYLVEVPQAENAAGVVTRIAELEPSCQPVPPPVVAPAPAPSYAPPPAAHAATLPLANTSVRRRGGGSWKVWVGVGVTVVVVAAVVTIIAVAASLPDSGSSSHHHYNWDLAAGPGETPAAGAALLRF